MLIQKIKTIQFGNGNVLCDVMNLPTSNSKTD